MSQAPPPPGGASASGPLGAIREPLMVAILSIITCGIYALYWYYKSFEEMKEHSGEGLGGVVGVLLAFFCGIITIFVFPAEIANLYKRDGRESPLSALAGLWNLIPLLGFFIYVFKTQGALNEYWESKGAVRA